MKSYWKTTIKTIEEYLFFRKLIFDKYERIAPLVEIYTDTKGLSDAYFCTKHAGYSERHDWKSAVNELHAFRYKKKNNEPIKKYILSRNEQMASLADELGDRYDQLPKEVLAYLESDRKALLELGEKLGLIEKERNEDE